jgi:signal transduction histidine kinase
VHLTDLDRLKGYQRGAVDYLSVPVNPELLRAKVSVFADLHRKTHQLEALNRELRTLSSNLIATQDDERRRIARELHDSLGQELSAAKMMTDKIIMLNRSQESTKEALEISNLIDHSIQQVRSISYLLHPPLLDEIGLQSALQFYLEGFTKRSGIEIILETKPSSFPRLTPEMETAMFRIVQEAVTNVFRHSGARAAWVMLAKEETRVMGTIRDNGKGIPEEIMEGRPDRIGVGIGGMRQRVKEFGGELRIGSANPGTIVEVMFPIEAAEGESQGSVASINRAAQREVAL